MITIYKYPFEIADRVEISLPRSAIILKVETQNGQPCLWAWVDTTQPIETRIFHVFGTGYQMNAVASKLLSHFATFQQGPFVWHMFVRAVD